VTGQGFTYQWAIRLPDGQLWRQPYMMPWGELATPDEPTVFARRAEAERALERIRQQAAVIGIDWHGWLEFRLCTPFSRTDPAETLVAELEEWMRRHGGDR